MALYVTGPITGFIEFEDSVGVVKRLDIDSVSAQFALNSIPTATVRISVGRDAVSPEEYSEIHDFVQYLNPLIKARVYLRLHGQAREGVTWTGEDRLIFDGFISSTSVSAGANQLDISVTLAHWLRVLDTATLASRVMHPATTVELSYPGFLSPDEQTLAVIATLTGNFLILLDPPVADTAQDFFANMFNTFQVIGDAWGCAIYPIIYALLYTELMNPMGLPSVFVNLEPLLYMSRITASCGGLSSPYYVPFRLMLPIGVNVMPLYDAVARGIVYTVIDNSIFASASQSVWDMLVTLASEFGYLIVPRVSDALVIPDIPGNSFVYRTITPDEYYQVESTTVFPRMVRGVVVDPDHPLMDGSILPGLGRFSSMFTFANSGIYSSHGSILRVLPPSWMSYAMKLGFAAPYSQLDFISPLKQMRTPLTAYYEMKTFFQSMLYNYAYGEMVRANLRGRTVILSTPLRFDIAPGSVVVVKNPIELGTKPEELDFIGTVERVAYSIDFSDGSAGCTIQLRETRNMFENSLPLFSMSVSPIYMVSWSGAPLMDDMEVS